MSGKDQEHALTKIEERKHKNYMKKKKNNEIIFNQYILYHHIVF